MAIEVARAQPVTMTVFSSFRSSWAPSTKVGPAPMGLLKPLASGHTHYRYVLASTPVHHRTIDFMRHVAPESRSSFSNIRWTSGFSSAYSI